MADPAIAIVATSKPLMMFINMVLYLLCLTTMPWWQACA